MKARLLTIAKWAVYPAFYLFCLTLFGYLTFPYERLKDRLIAEFDKEQRSHGGTQRLSIDRLTSYWWTGVEVEGAKLTIPAEDVPGGKPEDKPKDAVITVDAAHVRVRILPLLIGRVRIDFWASAFDGEISGSVPYGGSNGRVAFEIEKVDLSKLDALTDIVGIPLKGIATGKLELDIPDLKLSKADGTLELTLENVTVFDGKTKIKGQLALPEAKLGTLALTAEAKEGVLKIGKFAGPGPDIELAGGDGKLALRDPWGESSLDLYLKFKFSDAYRGKNDITKSLLGAPGSNAPALMDLADPKIKKAKRADGFYGWHVYGALKRLKFDPAATSGPELPTAKGTKASPFTVPKPPSGPSMPLGPSRANDDHAGSRVAPPAPPPPPPPPPPPAAGGLGPAGLLRPTGVEQPAPAPAPEPVAPEPAPAPVPEQPEAPAPGALPAPGTEPASPPPQ